MKLDLKLICVSVIVAILPVNSRIPMGYVPSKIMLFDPKDVYECHLSMEDNFILHGNHKYLDFKTLRCLKRGEAYFDSLLAVTLGIKGAMDDFIATIKDDRANPKCNCLCDRPPAIPWRLGLLSSFTDVLRAELTDTELDDHLAWLKEEKHYRESLIHYGQGALTEEDKVDLRSK